MYLLDSDIIIDYLKGKEPGKSLIAGVVRNDLFISIITWMEIVYGIKKPPFSVKQYQDFENFLSVFSISIISIDKSIAECYIDLRLSLERIGTKLDDFDLLIASTAIANKLKLVTRNTKHFSRIKNLSLSV